MTVTTFIVDKYVNHTVVEVIYQTLSRVFDISSQSKQKQRSKRRIKIVKIYAK